VPISNRVLVTIPTVPAWTGRVIQGNGHQREAVSTVRIGLEEGVDAAAKAVLLFGGTASHGDLANVQDLGRLVVKKFLLTVAAALQELLKTFAVSVYNKA
jgi:hypothetical protein